MSDSEYISRDVVDTKLLAMEERFIDNPFALTAIAMVMNEIDKITAADVAPIVHGHWKWVQRLESYECSACCGEALCDDWGNEQLTDYCPHCGAKMDESEDSTDG